MNHYITRGSCSLSGRWETRRSGGTTDTPGERRRTCSSSQKIVQKMKVPLSSSTSTPAGLLLLLTVLTNLLHTATPVLAVDQKDITADIDKVMRDEAKIQAAHAESTVSSHKHQLPRWGERGYYTKLHSIVVTGAELEPAFSRDIFYYNVVVRSARDRFCHIMPDLAFHHFPPRYPPKLSLDGIEHVYSSLEPILIPFHLNETNAALDYTAELLVSDPKDEYNAHTYYLRMLQAPAPDLVKMVRSKCRNIELFAHGSTSGRRSHASARVMSILAFLCRCIYLERKTKKPRHLHSSASRPCTSIRSMGL